jgi:hypothetical protein
LNQQVSVVLENYCRAWNAGDIDRLFDLFAESAIYQGSTKRICGRTAIRQMYESSFSNRAIRDLEATVVTLRDGTIGVLLSCDRQPVALNRFRVAAGLIVWHDLTEDPATITDLSP